MSDEEEWRAVVGFETLYEVSSLGRVRSLPHSVTTYNGGEYIMPGRILKQNPTHQGYLQVKLYFKGVSAVKYVHRLVAEAHLENPNELPAVLHWDDVKSHNTISNLRWGTAYDNQKDSIRNGRQRNGRESRTHCPQKHEYTPENTYIRASNGHRVCRACSIERSKKNYRKGRAETSQALN